MKLETLEQRVARLEQWMSSVMSGHENNRANIEYMAMMTDVELDEEVAEDAEE